MEPETEPETEPIAEDEDLSELEEALAADADELEAAEPEESPSSGPAQVIQADLAFIADFALAYFSEDENLQTGAHDPTETGFNLQQLELALGAAVDPYFRLDGNLVFSQFGVEIEEIYATTLALPHKLQVRAGQFLTRIGRINSTHPHSWRFVDQPLALGRIFGGEGNRGLGVELSWLSPLPWYVELVASVTDPAGEASARSFLGAQDLGLESPFDFQSSLAIKQFFPAGPNWSIAWGLSAATGPNPTGHDNRTNVFATDLYIKYRPIDRQSHTVVSLTAEYFYRRRQIPADVLADHSMYATLLWRFARRWTVAGRYELGTPASSEGADTLDPEWTDERQRVSAALTFFPTEFSRLRAQTALDYPGWQDEPIASAILAAEFLIGAHGAHEF